MADIFLAYSRANEERALKFKEALSESGFSVFWDVEIPAGKTWDTWIGHQIDIARCVIVLWSVTAVKSENVLDEASRAKSQSKLIPVMITKCSLPHGYTRMQTPNFVSWNNEPKGPKWERLVSDIKTHFKK